MMLLITYDVSTESDGGKRRLRRVARAYDVWSGCRATVKPGGSPALRRQVYTRGASRASTEH